MKMGDFGDAAGGAEPSQYDRAVDALLDLVTEGDFVLNNVTRNRIEYSLKNIIDAAPGTPMTSEHWREKMIKQAIERCKEFEGNISPDQAKEKLQGIVDNLLGNIVMGHYAPLEPTEGLDGQQPT